MKKITNEALRSLCINNDWFTCGTNSQYDKLFYANEHFCPIEELATIIWLCSDGDVHGREVCRRDVLEQLEKIQVTVLMRTNRGQSARIIFDDGHYRIQLSSNGNWVYPKMFDNEFSTEGKAMIYFEDNKGFLHS